MPWKISVPPVAEPVSLAEVKAQLTLETDEDDVLISTMIGAAREHAEGHCNRGFVEQTIELTLDAFPSSARTSHTCAYGFYPYLCQACSLFIELPFGKLAEEPEIELKYINAAGDEITLVEDTDYVVDAVSVPGRIHLAPNKSWPTTRPQWNAVKVTYTVGSAIDDVPASVRQAILLLVSQMYEHRTPEVTGVAVASIKFSYEALLSQHRIYSL